MNKIMGHDIEKIYIFKGVSIKTKEHLIEKGTLKKIDKKEILFHEKDKLNKVYILLEGKVSIFKISESADRKIIFILKQGEMINEILLDDKKTSTVGCEAFEKSLLIEYKTEDFIRIMEEDFTLTKNIFIYMERRTRRLYRQLKNSISIKMDKKLAAKLYRIGNEFGIDKGEWIYINMDLTITYLADMLGCKRETLSRSMKILQDKGLVKVNGKKIYLKSKELSAYFKGTISK